MTTPEPRLSVYLIHYGAAEWCASATRSILSSRGITPMVTVVDNGGADDLVAQLPASVRIIGNDRNIGFAGASNVAIADWFEREPDSQYLVVGSHDLHVEERALAELLHSAERYERYGILAPWVRGREHRMRDPLPGEEVIPVEWVSGTCMLLRKGCLRSVGGFDEAFGSYVEDVEFCLRAGDAGWLRGVVPASRAWGLGSADSWQRDVRQEVNAILLGLRRGGVVGMAKAALRVSGLAAFNLVTALRRVGSPVPRDRALYWCGVRLIAVVRATRAFVSGSWRSRRVS